jgi:hypothetical protein
MRNRPLTGWRAMSPPPWHRGAVAVAQALARLAVHHIAAQGEAFVGPGDPVVDAIQQFVGRLEVAGARVSRADEIALDVRHRRRPVQPRDVGVTEGVIVETGAHRLARFHARDVFVALVVGSVATARGRVVGVLDLEVLSRRRSRRKPCPRGPGDRAQIRCGFSTSMPSGFTRYSQRSPPGPATMTQPCEL